MSKRASKPRAVHADDVDALYAHLGPREFQKLESASAEVIAAKECRHDYVRCNDGVWFCLLCALTLDPPQRVPKRKGRK